MGKIIMSQKERKHLYALEKLKNREITQKTAARLAGLTTRQVRNKLKRYVKMGAVGIVHKNRGKANPHRTSEKIIGKIRALLSNQIFEDWGPTMITEYLMKSNIKLSRETTRQIMISENFWHPKRSKVATHRIRRERKEHFGELVQFDGSDHAWLEERAPKSTLLLFIDDATSIIVWAGFYPSESTNSVLHVSKNYFEKWGTPEFLYTDFGSVYRVNVNNKDNDKKTQYERGLKELGVGLKHARTPQAKGRVERCFGTLQNRLVKELRINDICNYKDANEYLQEVYIPEHNKRYSLKPKHSTNLHKPIDRKIKLDNILCRKEKRVLRNDFTIQYKKRNFQLEKDQPRVIRPGEKITITEHVNGKIMLWKRCAKLNYHEIIERNLISKEKSKIKTRHLSKRPSPDHPWKKRLWPDRRYVYGRP
jgi:hypothetical protein